MKSEALRYLGKRVYTESDDPNVVKKVGGRVVSQIRSRNDPKALTKPAEVIESVIRKRPMSSKEREIVKIYNQNVAIINESPSLQGKEKREPVTHIDEIPAGFYGSGFPTGQTVPTELTRIRNRNIILEFFEETIYTVTSWGRRKEK